MSSPTIEVQDAATEQVIDGPIELRLKARTPMALKKRLDTGAELHHRHACRDELLSWLVVQPSPHRWIWLSRHQLRHDVRIEDDHSSEPEFGASSSSK